MDPNANLAEIRNAVADIITAERDSVDNAATGAAIYDTAVRLAELVEALDSWVCKGGFLPDAWKGGR